MCFRSNGLQFCMFIYYTCVDLWKKNEQSMKRKINVKKNCFIATYVIFDTLNHNVKFWLVGKYNNWSLWKPRFKPWYQQSYTCWSYIISPNSITMHKFPIKPSVNEITMSISIGSHLIRGIMDSLKKLFIKILSLASKT